MLPGSIVDLLDEGERARAAAIIVRERADRFARTRGLLRWLLGGYTDATAASLELTCDAGGKPRLAGPGAPAFNVSHSGDLALLAFSAAAEVGVDVEIVRAVRDPIALARRALEEATVRELEALDEPRRERGFLQAWAAYEARVKCAGGEEQRSGGTMLTGPSGWCEPLPMGSEAVGAIASTHRPQAVRLLDWHGAAAARPTQEGVSA
jgi:phosphopantetheinyl transferase